MGLTEKYGPNERPMPEGPAREAGTPPRPSTEPASPGKPVSSSNEAYLAAREAMLNPRQQLRNAVALQVGQLSELALTLSRLQAWMQVAAEGWAAWCERSQIDQEVLGAGLRNLTEAKDRQEESLRVLRQGMIAARDEDTARLEATLRNLASAVQALTAASATVDGTGMRFAQQVTETQADLERSLTGMVEEAGTRLDARIQRLRGVLKPLAWVGGSLGVLLAADLVLRLAR